MTPTVDPKPELPVELFPDATAWETWLGDHHASSRGVWLRLAKKGSGLHSVSYAEALDAALCFGWIDGQKRSYDARSWLQKFTPRGRKSVWSRVNRDKVAALTDAGRMRPAGEAAVEAARADGRWDAAYDPPSTATVPDDLAAALEASPEAAAFFATLNSANRYAILWRIQTAKRAETRARNIAKFVAMLERGETLHP
jgi:uncharacterized protein YdeI (YjbR/CyaY-like superfamily)